MRYKIGKVAAFFGLTNESLRNYERAGLITSTRKEGSNLRYFDIEMIAKMVGIRMERNLGMSIREIQQIYDDMDEQTLLAMMQQKIGEQELRLQREQLILERARWIQQQVENAVKDGDKFQVVQRPLMYLLCYRTDDMLHTLHIDEQRQRTWTENILLVQNVAYYDLDFWTGEVRQLDVALGLEERYASTLKIDVSAPIRTLPAGAYLQCTLLRPMPEEPFGNQHQAILAYCERHRLRPAEGIPYAVSTFAFHRNGEKQSYVCLYLPIQTDVF